MTKTIRRRKGFPKWARWTYLIFNGRMYTGHKPKWEYLTSGMSWGAHWKDIVGTTWSCIHRMTATTESQRRASLRRIVPAKRRGGK